MNAAQSTAEVAGSAAALTVNELALAFWRHAQSYYDSRMQSHLKAMIRILRRYFGSTPAAGLGPKALMLVRDAMVNGDLEADPPRKPWSRQYVNSRVLRLIGMFKWAASLELVSASLHIQLRMVPAIRKGKTKATDRDRMKPVPQELIDGIRPHLNRHVAALMDLQLLTGARSGELLKLRPCDIVMDKQTGVWTITLDQHKTARHGHRRVLYVGPRGQEVLRPFLADRPITAFFCSRPRKPTPSSGPSGRRIGRRRRCGATRPAPIGSSLVGRSRATTTPSTATGKPSSAPAGGRSRLRSD